MENGYLPVKLVLIVLTNLTPDVYMWTCTIWMTSFAASGKWSGNSEQVFTKQINFQPTSIGKHNCMGHLFPCAIDFKTNHPPTTSAMDWDAWYGNWAAPCYFNEASPTGSPRWGHCLQRHLACEGLYTYVCVCVRGPRDHKNQRQYKCVIIGQCAILARWSSNHSKYVNWFKMTPYIEPKGPFYWQR